MEKPENVVKITYTLEELEDEISDLLSDKEVLDYHRVVRKHNHLLTLLEAKKKLSVKESEK